jgi:hypothetical protein
LTALAVAGDVEKSLSFMANAPPAEGKIAPEKDQTDAK